MKETHDHGCQPTCNVLISWQVIQQTAKQQVGEVWLNHILIYHCVKATGQSGRSRTATPEGNSWDHTDYCCQACCGLLLWSTELGRVLCPSCWVTQNVVQHQCWEYIISGLECICSVRAVLAYSRCSCRSALCG